MLKSLFIMAGIFMVNLTPVSLLNKPLEVGIAVTNNDVQETETRAEQNTIIMLKEKLNEKYVGVDVRTTSKKELVIQIVGDEDYFNSVKTDLESIAKSVIKSSTLKDYTVDFERWDLFKIPDEVRIDQQKLHHLTKNISEGLKDVDIIGDIGIHYQKSITIHTSIKGTDKNAHKQAMEIDEKLNKILDSKKLKSISHSDSYEIKVLNTNGKVIN